MKQTISILVENQAGVLNRITGLFSRRAFNIDSLAVGVTDDPTISRITIIVDHLPHHHHRGQRKQRGGAGGEAAQQAGGRD